jgi:hypothetical protein
VNTPLRHAEDDPEIGVFPEIRSAPITELSPPICRDNIGRLFAER